VIQPKPASAETPAGRRRQWAVGVAVGAVVVSLALASFRGVDPAGLEAAQRIALPALLLLWTLAAWRQPRPDHLDRHDAIALSALALCASSLEWSVSKQDTLDAVLGVASWFALYWVLRRSAGQPIAIRATVLGVLGLSAVVAAYAVLQVHVGLPSPRYWLPESAQGTITTRASSLLENPNVLAFYLLPGLALAVNIALSTRANTAWMKVSAWTVFALLGAGLVATSSRSGWLAAAVIVLVSALIWLRLAGRRTLLRVLPIAAIVAWLVLWQGVALRERVDASFRPDDRTAEHRVFMWDVGLSILQAHPVAGAGASTFKMAFSGYRPEGDRRAFAIISDPGSAHNDYVQIGAELGGLGLLTAAAVVCVSLVGVRPWPQLQTDYPLAEVVRASAFAAILGGLVYGLFQTATAQTGNMLLIVALVALSVRTPATAFRVRARRLTRSVPLVVASLALIVACTQVGGGVVFRRGLALAYGGRQTTGLRYMLMARNMRPLDPMCYLGIGGVWEQRYLGTGSEKAWYTAMAAYQRAASLDRTSGIFWVKMAHLWELENDSARASECYRHAVRLDPYEATYRFQLGRLLAAQGRRQEAVSHLQVARDVLETRIAIEERRYGAGTPMADSFRRALSRVEEKIAEMRHS